MLNDLTTLLQQPWLAAIVIWLIGGRLRAPLQKWLCGPSRFDIQITEGQCAEAATFTGMSGARSQLILLGTFMALATTVFGYLLISGAVGAPVWALFALITASAASGILIQAATTFTNVHRVQSAEPGAKIRMESRDYFEVRSGTRCLGVGQTPARAWGEAWRCLCVDVTTEVASKPTNRPS